MARLACEDHDPDLWFSALPQDRQFAQLVCGGCPASAACLQLALQGGERYGVWGGVDLEDPRRASRRTYVKIGRPRKTKEDVNV